METREQLLVLQTGYLTVLAENPLQELQVNVTPTVVPSTGSVTVTINPRYATTLYDLDSLFVRVEDPAGGIQSVPVTASPRGGYEASISGMVFQGTHIISVMARSGNLTYNDPGESWSASPSHSVPIPGLLMGQTASFYVTDGKQVTRQPRPEEEKDRGGD